MTRTIELTRGQVTIVDSEDYNELNQYKWSANKMGKTQHYYAVRKSPRAEGAQKTILMHREIMKVPNGMHTDHINHNPLDNRKANLRVCTNSQNQMNSKKQSNNTSGVTGVYWNKSAQKWQAGIMIEQKQIHLGFSRSLFEACCARKSAENKYFGKFAYGNG